MTLETNVFNTKWSHKLMTFINEKTFRKFPLIFDIKNWFWKYNFGTFCCTVIHRHFFLFLWGCWFLGKNLSNIVPLVWKLYNSCCLSAYLRPSDDEKKNVSRSVHNQKHVIGTIHHFDPEWKFVLEFVFLANA